MGFNLPLSFLQGHYDTAQALRTCARVKSPCFLLIGLCSWTKQTVGFGMGLDLSPYPVLPWKCHSPTLPQSHHLRHPHCSRDLGMPPHPSLPFPLLKASAIP